MFTAYSVSDTFLNARDRAASKSNKIPPFMSLYLHLTAEKYIYKIYCVKW